MGRSMPEAKADLSSHPPHFFVMNTTKSGFKALISAAVLGTALTTALPTLAQGTVQAKKASSPILCYLALRGSERYSGPCTLSIKTDGIRTWYSVDMINFGTTFVRQGEGLYSNEMNGGSFRATPVDRGSSLIINWNFNNLVISRTYKTGYKPLLQGELGRSVSAIMDSFFGFRN